MIEKHIENYKNWAQKNFENALTLCQTNQDRLLLTFDYLFTMYVFAILSDMDELCDTIWEYYTDYEKTITEIVPLQKNIYDKNEEIIKAFLEA